LWFKRANREKNSYKCGAAETGHLSCFQMASSVLALLVFSLVVAACFSRSLGPDENDVAAVEAGDRLRNFQPGLGLANPEELGPYLEGDMIQTQKQGRNGMIEDIYHWPYGIVPYVINGTFDDQQKGVLQEAFEAYHQHTCVRFVERTNENDYIYIQNTRTGCWANVGRAGGAQGVNLQTPNCMYQIGTPIHELMHALGFLHEQNRYERDDYIKVEFTNILPSSKGNFAKAAASSTCAFGVGYDYDSVMHYSPYAFSVNRKPTIIPNVRI
jgi:Astacin (Peptidase family M12A)